MIRFLQPCLLLLHRRPAHGYSLLEELGEFGFEPGTLDPSLVYRALRELEAEGWVTSSWAGRVAEGTTGGHQPAHRGTRKRGLAAL